ncbi:uncharacterized protein LOC121014266 [Herpailurus yagouaroundi]|uniref:uncharacterized protein LOC121014266 n=1 Tax=Herpailurus yagouaroundi TaxID=1608482 RepID=UPI001AD614EE|nr:uncharacterized protein LOC121014266 [Puma yagouaroundi]
MSRPPERPPSRRAAALARDTPAGPGVSVDAFPIRDPRPEPASRPGAAAVTIRPAEGPSVTPARSWGRSESRPPSSGVSSSSSGPCRLLGPRGAQGRAAHAPASFFGLTSPRLSSSGSHFDHKCGLSWLENSLGEGVEKPWGRPESLNAELCCGLPSSFPAKAPEASFGMTLNQPPTDLTVLGSGLYFVENDVFAKEGLVGSWSAAGGPLAGSVL